MEWSEGDLRAGLEAAERAARDPDFGFRPPGMDETSAMSLLEELMRRGWTDVEAPLRGDGRLMAARGVALTRAGHRELTHWRQPMARTDEAVPGNPNEAWNRLREHAEPFSPFERTIDAAIADLEGRGMFASGPSIRRAMEIAYDHGLIWSGSKHRFVARRDTDEASFTERVAAVAPDARKVFVVYGRDAAASQALFRFLRALNLYPLEWEQVVAMTGRGSPYIGDVLIRGFREAQAAVILFTPDDEARLHDDLHGPDEPAHERELTCQPRPNVLIEAGMALAFQPERTIIAQVGHLRPVTDLTGRHVVHLGTPGSLLALATRLRTAGCPVDLSTRELVNDDDFAELGAQKRQAATRRVPASSAIPRGTRLTLPEVEPSPAELSARLIDRGANDHLLEVRNRGGVPLTNVHWEVPPEATSWAFLTDVLPEYPIERLEPRDYVRVPVAIALGGPAVIRVNFVGTEADGTEYRTTIQLSIYG